MRPIPGVVVKSTENVKIVRLKIKNLHACLLKRMTLLMCVCAHAHTNMNVDLVWSDFLLYASVVAIVVVVVAVVLVLFSLFRFRLLLFLTPSTHTHTHSIRFELFFLVRFVCLGVSE